MGSLPPTNEPRIDTVGARPNLPKIPIEMDMYPKYVPWVFVTPTILEKQMTTFNIVIDDKLYVLPFWFK